MKHKKFLLILIPLFFALPQLGAAPLGSASWGFSLDLPEAYVYTNGDGKDLFSFESPEGAKFDIVVYHSAPGMTSLYSSIDDMAKDVQRRLNNKGEMDNFEYREKKAYILELSFLSPGGGGRSTPMEGWALCMELGRQKEDPGKAAAARPLLLAMAYGPKGRTDLQILHFSALDSLAPEESDRLAPGPITEYSYPIINRIKEKVFGLDIYASIYKEDAEAAQALVDREFQILKRYQNAPNWKDAWIRFYRAIYRDSFDRLSDLAFQVERKLNIPPLESREFANRALQWVQSFNYERDLMGSDFQNLVTAAFEGRGDCDSRSMLWAIIMKQANINSAMMVSRYYSHAMGLADLPGPGARFEVENQKLLVAETTAKVSIGLIGETVSEVEHWIGISFE